MASRNIIIQEDGSAKQLNDVAKIKTYIGENDFCYWVPEDSVQLATLNVTHDGDYYASNEGYYGYSEVHVSGVGTTIVGEVKKKTVEITNNNETKVLTASDEGLLGYSIVEINVNVVGVVGKDQNGDDEIHERKKNPSNPDEDIITTNTLPYAIAITTQPNKLDYTLLENMDYSGIEVQARIKSGSAWSSNFYKTKTEGNSYSNGMIPFDELILPIKKAGQYEGTNAGSSSSSGSGGSGGGSGSSGGNSSVGNPGSGPATSVADPSKIIKNSGSGKKLPYSATGDYEIVSVGSINSTLYAALMKLGTTYSGLSYADIVSTFSDFQGVNPALVVLYTGDNPIDNAVLSVFVFYNMRVGDRIKPYDGTNARVEYPCRVYTFRGVRTEAYGNLVLSRSAIGNANSAITIGSHIVGDYSLDSTLLISETVYDDHLSNLGYWTKLNTSGRFTFSYTRPTNVVTGTTKGGWERAYYAKTVTPNTDYTFSFNFISHRFTENNDGTGRYLTYVYVLKSAPPSNSYLDSGVQAFANTIEKVRVNSSGSYYINFNSGDRSTVYFCIDWAAITDGTNVNIIYSEIMLTNNDEVSGGSESGGSGSGSSSSGSGSGSGGSGSGSGSGGSGSGSGSGSGGSGSSGSTGSGVGLDPSKEYDQTIPVYWERPGDGKRLATSFTIHIGPRQEGWMDQ